MNNHVIIVFILNGKLPGEITLQGKVPSCCFPASELRCLPCTVSAAATFLFYLLFPCFLISRLMRVLQSTSITQELLLSKL